MKRKVKLKEKPIISCTACGRECASKYELKRHICKPKRWDAPNV